MYRFLLQPRWLAFHALVIAAVILMTNLGMWQLRRLDERREFNDQVAAAIDEPARPLDEVLAASTDPADVEWRAVSAVGEYLAGEQVLVVNRSQGGQAGDMVVTPMQLADGRILLVERGFVPLGAQPAAPPEGAVEVTGHLRPSQERRRGGLTDPAEGELREVQRIDIDRLAPQLPGDVVPAYVELTSSAPGETGPYPVPPSQPELTERNHLSYAVQWFIFAACVVIGWVLAVRHSASSRRPSAAVDDEVTPAPAAPSA
jgi:cytochrome oxidase assembly protein ShyY1